jgi:hypothetical protein
MAGIRVRGLRAAVAQKLRMTVSTHYCFSRTARATSRSAAGDAVALITAEGVTNMGTANGGMVMDQLLLRRALIVEDEMACKTPCPKWALITVI